MVWQDHGRKFSLFILGRILQVELAVSRREIFPLPEKILQDLFNSWLDLQGRYIVLKSSLL